MRLVLVTLLLYIVTPLQAQIDILEERQLFVDDFIVESSENLDYKLHFPIEVSKNDLPYGYYQTVIKQGKDKYFLYYRDYFDNYNMERFDGNFGEVTRLKYSENGGKDWGDYIIKNEVDSLKNVVLYKPPFNHNFTPFLDKNPNALESEKFKAISGIGKTNGLSLFYSKDGVNWFQRETPLVYSNCKACFDSQNILFWSEIEKKYVLYYRVWSNGYRSIAKRTSHDLSKWSEETLLFVNEKGEHLYTSGLFPYFREESLYIGLATRFFPKNGSTTDIVLLSSRHGKGIQRKFKESIIRPGLKKENWGNRSNYITLNGILPFNENEMILLARGKYYKMRKDGFASLSSKYTEGYMISKPVFLKSKRIEINYETSAGGYIRIELVDSFNKIIEQKGNNILIGNKVNGHYTFNVSENYIDKPIRLKIYLKEADIYSFKFIK